MKKKILIALLLITSLGGVITYTASPQGGYFTWTWHERNIIILIDDNGSRLQLGLRHDGVVVWRELNSNGTNNSPAENGRYHTIAPREVRPTATGVAPLIIKP